MAYTLPNESSPSAGLSKAFTQGTGLYNLLMQHAIAKTKAKHENELRPSGDVANALYVEQMAQQYGEDDPRTISARAAHQMGLDARKSLIDYRDVLNQTAGIRATSPLGKTIQEGRGMGGTDIVKIPGRNNPNLNMNAMPQDRNLPGQQQNPNDINANADETGSTIMPDNEAENEQQQLENEEFQNQKAQAYEKQISKFTSDPDARKKVLASQNIEKTIDNLNVDDLVNYSGLKGGAEWLKDVTVAASTGQTPERLRNYATAETAAKLLAKQVRQFYGDSIQPSAVDAIGKLTNPSTWSKNPDLAKAQLQQFLSILGQETETYRNATESPVKLQKNRKIGFKDGMFQVTVKGEKAPNLEEESKQMDFLNSISPRLIAINPDATPENIIYSAKQEGITVEEAVRRLLEGAQNAR